MWLVIPHQPRAMWPGVLPQSCISPSCFACGRGLLPSLALALLARTCQGRLPGHASCGQGVLPSHTQCASEAAPGLHGHRHPSGLGPPPPPPPPVAPWTMTMDYGALSTNDNSSNMDDCSAMWLLHGCYCSSLKDYDYAVNAFTWPVKVGSCAFTPELVFHQFFVLL